MRVARRLRRSTGDVAELTRTLHRGRSRPPAAENGLQRPSAASMPAWLKLIGASGVTMVFDAARDREVATHRSLSRWIAR